MQKFRGVLIRWDGGDLSMLEAGELPGFRSGSSAAAATAAKRLGRRDCSTVACNWRCRFSTQPRGAIWWSIIDIGKSPGIDVIAEGVETMDRARILRKLGCQTMQGYAFAKALSNANFERFLRDRMRVAV